MYEKIPDDDYRKLLFQTRGQLYDIMTPLEKYGQKPFVDGAIEEIMEIIEKFGMRVRGKEIPMLLGERRNPR